MFGKRRRQRASDLSAADPQQARAPRPAPVPWARELPGRPSVSSELIEAHNRARRGLGPAGKFGQAPKRRKY
jgi:hypothetical protein